MKKIKTSITFLVLVCSIASFIFLNTIGANYGFDTKVLLPDEKIENVVKSNTVPSSLPDISMIQKIIMTVSDIIKAI